MDFTHIAFNLSNNVVAIHSALMLKIAADEYGLPGLAAGIFFKYFLSLGFFEALPSILPSMAEKIRPENSYSKGGMATLWPYVVCFVKLFFLEVLFSAFLFSWDRILLPESASEDPYWMQALWCIPKCFLWELALDFFHYWIHRTCHLNKTLYTLIHAEHHEDDHIGPLSTLKMSMLEYISVVAVPSILAFCVVNFKYTPYQIHILMFYRSIGEIAGHSGLKGEHWHSFYQIPFPLSFTINQSNHDLHHTHLKVNYSKRFKLWDLVFGTFDTLDRIEKERFMRRVDIRMAVLGLFKSKPEKVPRRRLSVLNPVGIDKASKETKRNYASSLTRGMSYSAVTASPKRE